jgi:hypothetical protein
MLQVCPVCINNLFSIQNVSNSCHLLVLSAWFPLGSTEVLAALPHLQTVVDHGHSVQLSFLSFSLQFYVVFSFGHIQHWIIACQYSVIRTGVPPQNDFFAMTLAYGFRLPSSDNIPRKGKTRHHSDTIRYDSEYVLCHIGELNVIWVCFYLLVCNGMAAHDVSRPG